MLKFLEAPKKIYPFYKLVTREFPLEKASEAIKVADSHAGIRVGLVS